MSDLHKLTIAEARDKLRAKEITSVELTQSCLDAIDAADALGAYVHKTPDLAIEAATAADARISVGMPPICAAFHWASKICSAPKVSIAKRPVAF